MKEQDQTTSLPLDEVNLGGRDAMAQGISLFLVVVCRGAIVDKRQEQLAVTLFYDEILPCTSSSFIRLVNFLQLVNINPI